MLKPFVAAFATVLAASACAQGYPNRPIRFLVPSSAGGGLDITARTLGQKLSQSLGTTIVVDNRGGASGSIGMELTARSAPDGYTIAITSAAHTAHPSTRRKLTYDIERDFVPITQVTSQPYVWVIHSAVPARSVSELIALGRSRAEGLTYGSSGAGGLSHFSGAMLVNLTGAKLVHVPYKGGGPALADLLAGQINMLFATPLEATPHLKSGRIRALAVSTSVRSPAMPDLPTVAEAGVPGFEVNNWYGVIAPAATPRDIVERLQQEIVRAVRLRDVTEQFARDGVDVRGTTREEFAAHIKAEIAKWRRVVADAGIRPE
jgi:tripartite-type tricarboxylate transporter receptor subunit TctC